MMAGTCGVCAAPAMATCRLCSTPICSQHNENGLCPSCAKRGPAVQG